jgi:lipopolysaccharide transport system permease protein
MVIDALVAPFQALARQRPVITTFVQREIRTRYVTSALGLGWVLVRPLLLLLLYTFVFSIVLKVRFGGSDSPLDAAFYIFCGIVPWLAFADGITRATTAVPEQAPLVKRMRFPSEILPVHQVIVALVLESLGLVILLVALLVSGRAPGWPLLSLLALAVPQFLLTAGIGWALGAVSVLVPDTRQIVSFGLMVWMYATPIFYPLSQVPARFQWAFQLNPMAYLVQAYRGAVIEHQVPAFAPFSIFCAVSVAVFIGGYAIFHRLKYEFADVL